MEVADLIAKLSAVNPVPYPVTYPVRKSVLTYYDATRSFVPASEPDRVPIAADLIQLDSVDPVNRAPLNQFTQSIQFEFQ